MFWWQIYKNQDKSMQYSNKVYTNFWGFYVPEGDQECELSTGISIDYLVVYESKYYLKVYLDNCAYKIVNKKMTDYLDENLFED